MGSFDEDLVTKRYNERNTYQGQPGRSSTQKQIKKTAESLPKVKTSKGSVKLNTEFNSKIYKDIFPPPNKKQLRNSISHFFFKNPTCKYDLEQNSNTLPKDSITESNDLVDELKINTESDDINRPVSIENQSNDYELTYFKSGEDIRRSYIAKLIYKKIWTPQIKSKNHNTLIIFDWDDTLLCTSFLTPNGVFSEDTKISEKDMEKIKKLEMSATNILKQAIGKGDTYIITNAAPGWVEYSAKRFYPEIANYLNKVTIVSARGEYEKKFPGDSRQWKILAFLETLKKFDSNLVTNLICLGDSVIEMEAAHILASNFQQAYIKTIKFRESPKPEELHKQQGLVLEQFDKIFSAVKNLTIRVEKKSKEEGSTILTKSQK
jgi:hypothetical protein